ncbi:MAG: DUF4910 domain-containing protein [Candidatus Brocadiia bacterium]
MYEPIWQAVAKELSGEGACGFAARIWEHARWNSFDGIRRTADELAAILRETGLRDVEVVEYPADGTTAFGGWVMPRAWDVEEATLEIAEPQVAEPVLARYRECPQSLVMYSAPTPPEGVVAELVAVDDAAKAQAWQEADTGGKLALVDGVGLDVGLHAIEHGAVGIVADAMKLAGSPHEKGPGHFDHARQWHNYTLPPWKHDRPAFGFSISPAQGRRLRQLLGQHPRVRLRAVVRSRLYDGTLPLVTGLLPGERPQEVALTGHLCEPGANDNASGCALGCEVVRAIAALGERGELPPLRRGLRPVFSFEVRGYQAFLASDPRIRRLAAGINLDMVGNDLSEARARSNLVFNFPALPAYTDAFAAELMERLRRDDPLFRFRTEAGALVDNLFGEPAVGAPVAVIGNWPDATYHTSLDTIDTLSPGALASMGRVAATYCAFLAVADLPEAAWLAHLVARFAQGEMLDAARRLVDRDVPRSELDRELERLAAKNVARLQPLRRLVARPSIRPTPGAIEANRHLLCSWSHLFPDEELARQMEKLAGRIRAFARRTARQLGGDRRTLRRVRKLPRAPKEAEPEASPEERRRAMALVPRRAFKGSLCFESLALQGLLGELRERTGLGLGWGAPHWLQLALFRSNGKRTAWEVWRWLRGEASAPGLATFCDTMEFLAEHGFVAFRPRLTGDDLLAAFREVGLSEGMVVMAHASLSDFGYVEGGPCAVVDALLEAIGPGGTLAMPTLSFSWVGHPPYEPATTPSRVGAVTETFRRRAGVARSPHPTHSVAALGPRAEEIVRDHTPDRPVFGPQSAYARLYELDARILMLCKLAANTSMHAGEHRAGLLLTDLLGHVREGRRRREVRVRRAPWHANFEEHYRVLFDRGLVRAAPLGEGTIHLMRARDAVDVAEANCRERPLLATGGESCQCEFCQNIRAHIAAQDTTADE